MRLSKYYKTRKVRRFCYVIFFSQPCRKKRSQINSEIKFSNSFVQQSKFMIWQSQWHPHPKTVHFVLTRSYRKTYLKVSNNGWIEIDCLANHRLSHTILKRFESMKNASDWDLKGIYEIHNQKFASFVGWRREPGWQIQDGFHLHIQPHWSALGKINK